MLAQLHAASALLGAHEEIGGVNMKGVSRHEKGVSAKLSAFSCCTHTNKYLPELHQQKSKQLAAFGIVAV